MLKLVHTGGIHIGKKYGFLYDDLNEEYSKYMHQAFFRLIKMVKERGVDILIICGNLFNSNFPDESDTKFVSDMFLSIPSTSVFIVPGEFDYLCLESLEELNIFSQNVHIFKCDKITKFTANKQACVYGIGYNLYHERKDIKSLIEEKLDKHTINIFCFYSGDEASKNGSGIYFEPDELSKIGADYIAVRDGCEYKQILNIGNTVMAACSGELVPFDLRNSYDQKGYIYMEIYKDRSNFRFIGMNFDLLKKVEIDTTNCKDYNEVIESIKKRSGNYLYEVILNGELSTDICIDEDDILSQIGDCRLFRITDKTTSKYVKGQYNNKDIKQIFAEKIIKRMGDDTDKNQHYTRVLRYGLSALKGGT